jgi:hypothetical protein
VTVLDLVVVLPFAEVRLRVIVVFFFAVAPDATRVECFGRR